KHNRNSCSRCLGGMGWSRRTCRNDHAHLSASQIGGERGQSTILTVCPTVFDGDIFTLDVAGFFETALECGHEWAPLGRGCAAKDPDPGPPRLRRAPRKRPRNRRAADQRDEIAAFHSITSSARASSVDGTSRPSVLAVLRLITSSYLVGACTGRSAGFSPLRMRSTYSAARRYWSTKSGP